MRCERDLLTRQSSIYKNIKVKKLVRMNKQTIAINNPFVRPDVYGALAVPVYNNVAFEFDDAAETAFNSGMAAISNTLLAVTAQGRNIVSSHHLFGNTLALISTTLKRFGVEPRLRDLTNLEAVAEAIDDKTSWR